MLPALAAIVEFVKWAAPKLPGLVPLLHAYAAEMNLGTPPDLAAWDKVQAEGDAQLRLELERRATVPE